MNNRERDAFEAWAKPFFFSLIRALRDTDDYDSLTTQAAWMAWQARAALGVTRIDVGTFCRDTPTESKAKD